MYNMMSQFLKDVFKHIDKAGSLPVRANDKRGDVFIGYIKDLDKMVLCYRSEMFFVPPDAFQIFDSPMYRLGTNFSALNFGKRFECRFSGNKVLHSNGKTVLREIVSVESKELNIFSKESGIRRVHYDKAYMQDKYARWFEELSDYYGGQTELWTDGRGTFSLVRTNGDLIAVALEVRI